MKEVKEMVNLNIFKTLKGQQAVVADTMNHESGLAYTLTPKHQLAQLASTGCMNQTFYASGEDQLAKILELTQGLDAEFIAKTAIYAREEGYMKDMPALLAAILSTKDSVVLDQNFYRMINNGKMLRNFVQIMRSGVTGRKSLGSRPKKLVQGWLLAATEKQLLNASIGQSPSLADVVKMVHPKANEDWRNEWFAWLIGRSFDEAKLPPITQAFEQYKRAVATGTAEGLTMPDVPFQMLTALNLKTAQWAEIATNGSWQMVRQNLNTFARHGVFELPGMMNLIAAKLSNQALIQRANVMPYQLMSAYIMTENQQDIPYVVKDALQNALEIAVSNVPKIEGKVVVGTDVSGSMMSPVTGYRQGATTSVTCVQVASLISAAVLRQNPEARIMPFDTSVRSASLNPRDSILTNAQKLAKFCGGGTDVSAPFKQLNRDNAKVDVVIIVSDNESWFNSDRYGATETMKAWMQVKARNPQAKLICIDIQPYVTSQAKEGGDILNIGGFSDAVFKMMASFTQKGNDANHWVDVIESIQLSSNND